MLLHDRTENLPMRSQWCLEDNFIRNVEWAIQGVHSVEKLKFIIIIVCHPFSMLRTGWTFSPTTEADEILITKFYHVVRLQPVRSIVQNKEILASSQEAWMNNHFGCDKLPSSKPGWAEGRWSERKWASHSNSSETARCRQISAMKRLWCHSYSQLCIH